MLYIIGLTALLIPTVVFAQAFGGMAEQSEYSAWTRDHRRETPGGVSQGNVSGGGVGEVGGRGLPVRLVLYRRIQDFIHGRMVKQKKSLN